MKRICKICCVVMTLVTLALTASPAMAQEKTMSGLYGEDLIWLFMPGNSTMAVKKANSETTFCPDGSISFREMQGIRGKIRRVVIEEGVTQIGSGMFKDCSALEEVVLPNSLTHIHAAAFAHAGVRQIVIPENVVYIGDRAFAHCKNLQSVTCAAQHPMVLGTDLYFDTPLDADAN